MNVQMLDKCKHLSEVSIPNLIKEIGLYAPIQINTFSNNITYVNSSRVVQISADVKQLYSLIHIQTPLYLPCADCKKELAFNQTNKINTSITPQPAEALNSDKAPITAYSADPSKYWLFSENLLILTSTYDVSIYDKASVTCKNVLLDKLPFFFIELSCSLNMAHTIRCAFCLSPVEVDDKTQALERDFLLKKLKAQVAENSPPQPTDEEKQAIAMCRLADQTLILKKVGQSPSLADMQFFNLQKYHKLLKTYYYELTRAIGLYASGIGIGSFVYLRRILEAICEATHKDCIMLPNWDEDKYSKSRFNGKIELMDQFGKKVLPDEIKSIKSKLYGVMSKGVHEYSEAECMELFPYIKSAIELILDQKLAELDKQEKINELTKKINYAAK